MNKHTWRHWINGRGYYHIFKSLKVYTAYCWHISEWLDNQGSLDPTDRDCTRRVETNYSSRYTNRYK